MTLYDPTIKSQSIPVPPGLLPFPEPTDITEQVANGVAVLDHFTPRWREQITKPFTSAAMQGFNTCVLGRVYGTLGLQPFDHYLMPLGFNGAIGVKGCKDSFAVAAAEWNRHLFPSLPLTGGN